MTGMIIQRVVPVPHSNVFVLALFVGLLLAGCGVARSNRIATLPHDQLATVSDRDICDGLAFNPDSANLQAEVATRRLGDCSQDHFMCVSWGYAFGSPEYMYCRSKLRTARLLPAPPVVSPRHTLYCTPTGASAGATMLCQ